jgi:hypothetical protein
MKEQVLEICERMTGKTWKEDAAAIAGLLTQM